jgi:predicted dehydrogenase
LPTSPVFRWGVLGPGSIAHRFVEGVRVLPDHAIQAVGSRTLANAKSFAGKYDIPNAHEGYAALVRDPEVDAVYVATPHPFHCEHTILALSAGKHVLCEKPFAINARQAEEMVAVARANDRFLMEAMWTRFFPIMEKLRGLVADGAIGRVTLVQADFGFRGGFDEEGRLYNPALGGGALLDVGVYTVSLASMLLGEPDRVMGLAKLHPETGVDETAAFVLGHSDGSLALLSTAIDTNTPHEAWILGTDGRIHLPATWWKPERMTLIRSGKPAEEIQVPVESSGFQFEIAEVAKGARAGKHESQTLPLSETVAIMRTMDRLREQWGLKYPME